MSVLGTISLSGLTTTTSDYITASSLEVTNSLTVDNGATVTLPAHSVSDAALSSNVMLLNISQTSTGDKTFKTVVTDGLPLQVQFDNGISTNTIELVPLVSSGTYNPWCQAGDMYVGGESVAGVVFGKSNQYSAIRFTNTNTDIMGNSNITFNSGYNAVANFDNNGQFNLTCPINSTYTSSTIYENQYLGDIWTQKALTCKNGLFIQNQITPGATTYASINSAGQAILATLSCPSITTTTQANADNSTKAATTAFVKNQNYITSSALTSYALLSGTQTFSGVNTFSQSITGVTELTADNSTKVATTAFVKNQAYITTAALSNYAQLTGVPQTFSNSNTFSQSITGVTEATADNSTKVATTAFVKNQAYITASALTPYALLASSNTFTATNTFNGRQTFTQTGNNTYPFLWRSNNATATTRQGYIGVTTTSGNFNGVATANDCVIMAADSASLDVGVLCLTTHSNTTCGIRITNADVLMTGTTIQTNGTLQANNALTVTGTMTTNGTHVIGGAVTGPSTNFATTSSNIGYTNKIITTSWLATVNNTAQNLYQFVFDNGANYKYGTYRLEYNVRMTSTVNTQGGVFNFDTTSAATNSLYMVALNSNATAVGSTYYYIWRASFILPIYSTTTWYFNGNSNVSTMDTNSYVQVTRLS